MTRMMLPLLAVILLVAGCAAHFFREDADRVHLVLRDGRAAEVQFASSLDGFELHRIERTGSKTWQITVPNRSDFRYFYLVDGRIHLPECPRREMDDFGSYNCLYTAEP